MKTKITLLVLTFFLGLTHVFANSIPSSDNNIENEIMTTNDNSIIISAGKRIYALDMNTYQATLLATSPYVNEINSIASDQTTGWIFYVSNHISTYNWTIYGYNVYTNTHKNFGSVRHFFTSTGHAYSSRGLASGGATFYNGKLYFAMEYPIYCYYYRGAGRTSNNGNPKDELSDNVRAAGSMSPYVFTNDPRNSSTENETPDSGRSGNGETPADFVIIDGEEANQLNDNVSDYIPEEDLPNTGASNDDGLQQRVTTPQAETYTYSYTHSTYNNNMYLLEISFNGLSDTSGQTTSVNNGRPVYDPWGYSSFLYRGELGDIVVDDNGQMYAATSYQVQAYNFNTNRYDWANNEDVYAQMAKDKHSNLQLLKNKRQCTTTYYNGCPHTSCTVKSFVQSYTAPASLRTYNNVQLGSLNEITGLDPYDVGKITDASDYINLTPPVSYKVKGTVYDDNDENGNFDSTVDGRLQGVLVTLYADNNADGALDSGDTVIDTRNSSSTGWYAFPDVQVANTIVAVTVPSNTNTTTYTATSPEIVAVTGSTDDVRVNFGINEALVAVNYDLFGTVYDDNNENASQDNGETGLENVTLTLYADNNADGTLDANDTVITTTTSAADGSYSFLHICVQNTIVAVTVPTNTGDFTYVLTTTGTQAIDSINTDVTGVDFGINEVQVIDYAISGTVYDDDDESGAQDAGEADLASVTVSLYDDANGNGAVDAGETVIATTTSATDGTYSFNNVTTQNTVVAVTVPTNTGNFTYTLTTAGEINTSSVNTDITEVNFGINEVEVVDYDISGLAYKDRNANGIFEPGDDDDDDDDGDRRFPNVVVRLFEDIDANGSLDSSDNLMMTTATGSDGMYEFRNVNKKNTIVKFTTPSNNGNANFTATTPSEVSFLNRTTNVTDVNFGVNEQQVIDYNISGTVFDDDNANGTQETAEAALENVTVTLYADNDNNGRVGSADTVLGTTTSAIDGTYSFANVTTANTLVAVTVPTNTGTFTYVLTTSAEVITSSATTDVTGVDFGINREEVINYNISGTVFDDDNANGVIDAAETERLENVTLTLYADNDNNGRVGAGDTVITTTTTAVDGTYGFANVTTRNTLVVVTVPADTADFRYTLTTSERRVTSSTINNVTDINFGINRQSNSYSVSGNVFNDDNGNGINDGDAGLSGIEVRLYADLNQNGRVDRGEPLLQTTTSNRDGNYQFSGLTDTHVIVQTVVPANTSQFQYLATTPVNVPLSSGTTATNVDFGIRRSLIILYNIRGVVWDDEDSDQIKDTNESRLSGIGVTLFNDANANGIIDAPDTAITTITTTATGVYEFTGVNLRNVIIKPTVPSNGTLTTPGERVVTSINTNVIDVDFGIKITSSLFQVTGVVFDDDNENGLPDPGEGSIDGLPVEIYVDTDLSGTYDPNFDTLVAFTQTSNGGFGFTDPNYLVDDVPAGQVFIVIVIPPDNPPFESWTPTYDPDSGTANPDGVYPTIMTGSLTGVNFGLNYVNLNSTSRNANTGNVVFTNDTAISDTPEDVSEKLRLYPNPTVKQIAINTEEFSGDIHVEIYNDRGYKVMATTVTAYENEAKVDVERLSPGMYYAKFVSNNKIASKKFVKK